MIKSSALPTEKILQIQNNFFGECKDVFRVYWRIQQKLEDELGVIIRKLEEDKLELINKSETKL